MAIIPKSDQFVYTGRGPIDSKALVKTYQELLSAKTWTVEVEGVETFVAYNGMQVAVWLNKDDTSKNGLYTLFDPLVTSAIKKPDITKESNWHKLAKMSDLASFTEKLDTLAKLDERVTALETLELFQKIDAESDLPTNFDDEDFNPNVTYYIKDIETGRLTTYIYEKDTGYICTTQSGGTDTSISKVEINADGELVIYYSNNTSEIAGTVVGRDGLTTAIQIGETIYTHNNGIIELPNFATIDYVDTKLADYVTTKVLEDYATKDFVEDQVDGAFSGSFKELVLFGGDADPVDD